MQTEKQKKELSPDQLRLKREIAKVIKKFPVALGYVEIADIFSEVLYDYAVGNMLNQNRLLEGVREEKNEMDR